MARVFCGDDGVFFVVALVDDTFFWLVTFFLDAACLDAAFLDDAFVDDAFTGALFDAVFFFLVAIRTSNSLSSPVVARRR